MFVKKGVRGAKPPQKNFGLFVAVFRDPNCFFALQIFGENFRPFPLQGKNSPQCYFPPKISGEIFPQLWGKNTVITP